MVVAPGGAARRRRRRAGGRRRAEEEGRKKKGGAEEEGRKTLDRRLVERPPLGSKKSVIRWAPSRRSDWSPGNDQKRKTKKTHPCSLYHKLNLLKVAAQPFSLTKAFINLSVSVMTRRRP